MSEHTQQNPYAIPAAIVIAGALIAGALYFAQPKQQMMPPTQAPAAVAPSAPGPVDQVVKGIQPGDHIKGNKDAKVVIVEFSDPECPFCRLFHEFLTFGLAAAAIRLKLNRLGNGDKFSLEAIGLDRAGPCICGRQL